MQAWIVADALRSACVKGHNWISGRASKMKTLKKGYMKIRPKIMPKGLKTFKEEHCTNFENDDNDCFAKCRPRFRSVDVIDEKTRDKSHYQKGNEIVVNFNAMNLNGL